MRHVIPPSSPLLAPGGGGGIVHDILRRANRPSMHCYRGVRESASCIHRWKILPFSENSSICCCSKIGQARASIPPSTGPSHYIFPEYWQRSPGRLLPTQRPVQSTAGTTKIGGDMSFFDGYVKGIWCKSCTWSSIFGEGVLQHY